MFLNSLLSPNNMANPSSQWLGPTDVKSYYGPAPVFGKKKPEDEEPKAAPPKAAAETEKKLVVAPPVFGATRQSTSQGALMDTSGAQLNPEVAKEAEWQAHLKDVEKEMKMEKLTGFKKGENPFDNEHSPAILPSAMRFIRDKKLSMLKEHPELADTMDGKRIGMALAESIVETIEGAADVVLYPVDKLTSMAGLPTTNRLVNQVRVKDGQTEIPERAFSTNLPDENGENPGKLKSFWNGMREFFVGKTMKTYELAVMPDGPEKDKAWEAYSFQLLSDIAAAGTIGMTRKLEKKLGITFEGDNVIYDGQTVDKLSPAEAKAVNAAGLPGTMIGSMAIYSRVSPYLAGGMKAMSPAIAKAYAAHPYITNALLTNAAEEAFEATIRKATGQQYTLNDTFNGMLAGGIFETGKLSMGGYKPDIEAGRVILNDAAKELTTQLKRTPSTLEIMDAVSAVKYPGTDMTFSDIHTQMARSVMGENRLVGLKQEGRPGIETPSTPPSRFGPSAQKWQRFPVADGKGELVTKEGVVYRAMDASEFQLSQKSGVFTPSKPEADGMEGRKYFDADPDAARNLGGMTKGNGGGNTVLVRVKATDLPDIHRDPHVAGNEGKMITSIFTTKEVNAKGAEYSVDGGKSWKPMVESPGTIEGATAVRSVFGEARLAGKKGPKTPDMSGRPQPEGDAPKITDQELIAGLTPKQKVAFDGGTKAEQARALEHLRLKKDLETNDAYLGKKSDDMDTPLDQFSTQGKADAAVAAEILKKGGTIEEAAAARALPKTPDEAQATLDSVKMVDAPVARLAGRVKQTFRTDKFNIDGAGQAKLKQVQQALGMEVREVRNWEEVEAAARELGRDPIKLLQRVQNNRQLTDAEVEALRQTTQASSDFLSKKYDMIADAEAKGDYQAVKDIEAKAEVYERILDSSVRKLIGGGTELGRGVAIYRKIAAQKFDDPTYWYKEAMSHLGDNRRTVRVDGKKVSVEGGKMPAELRTAIDSLMKNKDALGMSYLMAHLKESNNWEKGVTLWKAGLLTSPTTHLANIGGNTTMMTLETVKDIPATIADTLLTGAKKGINRVFGTSLDESRTKMLTTRMLTQQAAGMYEGAKKGAKFFRTGQNMEIVADKWDIPKQVNYNNTILQVYTQSIFRALGAEDMVFRQGFIRKSLAESAALQVKNMDAPALKKAMDALPEGVPRTTKSLVNHFVKNPSDEAVKQAIKYAEYGTFQSANALTSAIQGAKRATTPGVRAGIDVIAPFTKTPTNVAARIVDYTPVGFMRDLAKQIKSPNQRVLVDSFGRSVTGTAVMALGVELAKAGLITGNAPTSAPERKLWEAAKKQPNSIMFMGKWRKLDRVSPAGNLLVIGAEFYELGQTKTKMEQYTQIGWEGIKTVTEQSFLEGLSSALKAVNEPDRFAQSFAENAIRGLVPNVIGRLAAGTDTYQRDPDGFNPLQIIQGRIPILSERLPIRLDVFGRYMEQPRGVFGQMLDPFTSLKQSDDPVTTEMLRLNQPLSVPAKGYYTEPEYQSMLQMRGKIMIPLLFSAMGGGEYFPNMTDAQKKQIDAAKKGFDALPDDDKRKFIKTMDAQATSQAHSITKMQAAQRITKELGGMDESDRMKTLKAIEKRDGSLFEMLTLIEAYGKSR